MSDAPYAGKSAYFGEVASRYDEDRRSEPLWEREQVFAREWIRRLAPGSSILDIPCGTGRFVPFFLECGVRVEAGDISADMVAEVRRRYPQAAIEARVEDAEHLSFPDDAVDGLVSWRFFHLLPEVVLPRVLAEFRRVCRGPILVEVLQVPRPALGTWARIKAWLRPWHRRLRPRRGGAEPWAHINSYSHSETTLLRLFGQAGLTVESRHDLDEGARHAVVVFQLRRSGLQT